MYKHLTYFFAFVACLSFLAVVLQTKPVSADVSYSCPSGQYQGKGNNQDIRYCYSFTCPSGSVQGGFNSGSSEATDPKKCYKLGIVECQTGVGCDRSATVIQDAKINDKKDQIQVSNNDNYKCPQGTYRGGLQSGQDSSKCYRCDARGCQDINQPVVNKNYDVCANADQACIDRQRREQAAYMQSIQNAAPNGFVLPGKNEEVQGTRNAQVFCEYYKTPGETSYDTNYIYRACIIGYEVGFGNNKICTNDYLFGARATHKEAPTIHAERSRAYVKDMTNADRDKIIGLAIAACQDGWNQYRVDYWYCGGNSGCQNSLRTNSARVVDPGPVPTRGGGGRSTTIDPNLPTPGAVIMQTGTPTQSCGSIQTAYFSCGGGGSDIESSSFWQILQVILNIMLALVGITAVGGIIYGAILYSSAEDNAEQVNQAKNIIKNVIIGLVLYLAMWAIIEYLIPGGILR